MTCNRSDHLIVKSIQTHRKNFTRVFTRPCTYGSFPLTCFRLKSPKKPPAVVSFEERCSNLEVYSVIKTIRHPELQVAVAQTIQSVIIIRIAIVNIFLAKRLNNQHNNVTITILSGTNGGLQSLKCSASSLHPWQHSCLGRMCSSLAVSYTHLTLPTTPYV